MSSVSRHYVSNTPQNMSQTDLSKMSSYTVTRSDAQLYYNGTTSIQIALPSAADAKWSNYPIIYITNMSPSIDTLMTFNLGTNVRVQSPDNDNYTSHFSIRGTFNGYIIYTGNNQWMLQGVGANFNGA